MVQVIVQHEVKDYDAWLPGFRAHDKTRAQFGCEGATVSRSLANPNDVVIIMRWKSAGGWDDFLANSDLKAAMEKAGVITPPVVTVTTDPVV